MKDWLAGASRRWWIAGGWALDLYLDRQTRPHADLDVGCFREDLASVRSVMDGWQFYGAREGVLERLGPHAEPAPGTNSVWCHPEGANDWWLEWLLDRREGSEWVFRRCDRVRRPLNALTFSSPDGTPYLRPEIQLLYKAKAPRDKDEADLAALLEVMRPDQKRWLARSLATWQGEHAWLPRLRRALQTL